MNKAKLIFGDDNGFCSLWDISKAEYDEWIERLDAADWDEKLEQEFYSHKIEIDTQEHGYVPDWAVYLAQQLNIDVESN